MMTASVIIGSTRQGRFSEKPARWILGELRKREAIEATFSPKSAAPGASYCDPRVLQLGAKLYFWPGSE